MTHVLAQATTLTSGTADSSSHSITLLSTPGYSHTSGASSQVTAGVPLTISGYRYYIGTAYKV